MKNIFDKLAWIGLFLFFVPTSLVMASWSSLPGDPMFVVKLGLENVLAAVVSPSYQASGELHLAYTERRFSEAQKLLAEKHSVQGLPYLTQQIEETKVAISHGTNAQEKQTLTAKYIATLIQVSSDLESQKQILTTTQSPDSRSSDLDAHPVILPPTPAITIAVTDINNQVNKLASSAIPTPTATPAPGPVLTTVVNTNTVTPPQNIMVALEITHTQQKIKQTIIELKKQEQPESAPDKENQKQEDRKDSKQESKPDQPSSEKD